MYTVVVAAAAAAAATAAAARVYLQGGYKKRISKCFSARSDEVGLAYF